MSLIKDFFEATASVFFPNTCVSCGEVITEGEFFCDFCFENLKRVPADKLCIKCGNEKKVCFCKKQVYAFEVITAPFYNDGPAQDAMYAFKLANREYIGRFFFQQMALAVKYSFHGVKLDGVCYVPLSAKSFRKRGFNQSEVLARGISEILGIPLIEGQLKCTFKSTNQHGMSSKERFKNIKGAYRSTKACAGKILLVDDIKTTGATLDECAKKLLSSGAESVYCVTGLITEYSQSIQT